MKNFLTSLIFSLSCLLVKAQQDRFIYLQSENKQSFFVKLNGKTFNSFPLGYVIIPKLDDGLYSLVIGFPGADNEQEFNCSINKKDVGFIIKNSGEKQLQLLNVQTNAVIVPGDVITKPVIAYEKETDPFSVMLANAVHDSTILRKDVVKEVVTEKPNELVTKDTSQIIVSNNELATADSSNKDVAKEIIPVKPEVTQKDSAAIISNTEVVINKPETKVTSDSTSKDIAKEVNPEKTEPVRKDSVITSPTDIVIARPDSVLKSDSIVTDLAKNILPEKQADLIQKDTSTTSTNDVAVTKSKKRKSKKNDNALQDSTLQQKEIVSVIPDKVPEIKDSQNVTSTNDITLVKSVIKRRSRKTNRDGIEMMYIDQYGDTIDTIMISIPSERKAKKDAEINSQPVVAETVIQQDDKTKDTVNKSKGENKITEEEKQIIKEANKEPVVRSAMINSDCKNFATEEDFLKTRKKMVAEDNDEDMIKAARKIFKTKCFTTEQIKNLSVLFLKDEGKYMFFDAAYPFVSDSDLYPTLEKQLTDNYYITRFRAMIHK